MVRALIAGWKEASLIDVKGAVTLTIWFCRCNLRCPFCHNWRLAEADPQVCREVEVRDALAPLIRSAARYADYVHLSGGEPLTQAEAVGEVFSIAREAGVPTSLNTNLTLPHKLAPLLKAGLVDHVATDVKYPWDVMTGLSGRAASAVRAAFIRGLREVCEGGAALELRFPVARGVPAEGIVAEASALAPILGRCVGRVYVVVNPIIGPPLANVRDVGWCEERCWPDEGVLEEVAEGLREVLGVKVYVNRVKGGAAVREARAARGG